MPGHAGPAAQFELLAPLNGLSGLHTLSLAVNEQTAGEGVRAVCQLTGLRQLKVNLPRLLADEQGLEHLRELAQLTQLTALTFDGTWARRASMGSQLHK